MLSNLASKEVGGFTYGRYRTSSHADASSEWTLHFPYGYVQTDPREYSGPVRPARAF